MADVNTQPAEQTESAASIIDLSLFSNEMAGGGQTRALFPSGPETDEGGLDASLLGSELVDLGQFPIPVDQFLNFGELGTLLSRSTATDGKNGEAISGVAGADGAITLDGEQGDFGVARINLLALFEAVGADALTGQVLSKAELTAGAGGAWVKAVDGVFEDPDGFGGKGQYRVAEANLELQSPLVEEMASQLYDAIGQVDTTLEDTINGMSDFTDLLSSLTALLPANADISMTVDSNIQDEVFNELLAQPITSKNEVLSIDLSTGTLYVDLDKAYSGERPEGVDLPDGINNQNPNTELISNEIYPIIAETIHDLIEEVIKVATNAIEGAISSITLNFEVTAEESLTNSSAVATWSVNLGAETVEPVTCTPSGLGGAALCTTIETLVNTTLLPVIQTAVIPIRDFLVGDGGHAIYDLLITDIKTNMITLPVRQVLEPVFTLATEFVSLQLNRQVETTCTLPDGTDTTEALEVSALSLGVLQSADAGRLNLGSAGVRTGACAAAIDPSITVDPTEVPAGTPTNVTGTGFTPSGDVELQLVDADGQPVGDPVTVTADENGDFPSTELPVAADVPPGTYDVRATDVTTNTPVTQPLNVTEPDVQELNIGLDPPTVPAGDPTNATGTGYTPDGPVTVQLIDPAGNPVGDPISTTAGPDGTFTVPVPTPADAQPGDYTVRGTDDTTTNSADAVLTVVEAGTPVITADPTSVEPGQPTDVSGTDFAPNDTVTVQLQDADGNPVGDPVEVPTDENGAFGPSPLTVPEGTTPGDYTIKGTDTQGGEATTPLTVTEPTGGNEPSITAD
ncbi:choice-of-anchor G family protein, partial [Glutamicibacter endophyticus]